MCILEGGQVIYTIFFSDNWPATAYWVREVEKGDKALKLNANFTSIIEWLNICLENFCKIEHSEKIWILKLELQQVIYFTKKMNGIGFGRTPKAKSLSVICAGFFG